MTSWNRPESEEPSEEQKEWVFGAEWDISHEFMLRVTKQARRQRQVDESLREAVLSFARSGRTPSALVGSVHGLATLMGRALREQMKPDDELFGTVAEFIPASGEHSKKTLLLDACAKRAMHMVTEQAQGTHESIHTHIQGMLTMGRKKGVKNLIGTLEAELAILDSIVTGRLVKEVTSSEDVLRLIDTLSSEEFHD